MHDNHISAGNTAGRYTPLRRWDAAGHAALVLAMLAACPGSAASSKAASASPAATPRTSAVRPSPDAGAATVALPVAIEKAHAEFRGALEAIHASLSLTSWNDWQILVDNPEVSLGQGY
jgi:hypothetical protein